MKKIIASLFTLAMLCTLISPVSVSAAPKKKKNCITLFEHKDYKGRQTKKICGSVKNLKNFNFNNITSSFRAEGMTSDYKVIELFKDANFKGKKLTIGKDTEGSYDSDLSTTHGKWNDVISSIRIK